MSSSLGVTEIVILCFVGLLGVGLPVAILVFLYIIYNKVNTIEGILKKE